MEQDQDTSAETSDNSPDELEGANTDDGPELKAEEAAPSKSPAEDSENQTILKAQDANNGENNSPAAPPKTWQEHLLRFHHDINGILAAKENFKLVAVDINARSSFSRNWSQESNRYFRLIVNLRRRIKGAKVGGKAVA